MEKGLARLVSKCPRPSPVVVAVAGRSLGANAGWIELSDLNDEHGRGDGDVRDDTTVGERGVERD